MVKLKRGLFRLWIVVSLVWVAGWVGYIRATCVTIVYREYCRTGLFGEWLSPLPFTLWNYANIAAVAVGVPVAILVLGVGLLWAGDGFASDD